MNEDWSEGGRGNVKQGMSENKKGRNDREDRAILK